MAAWGPAPETSVEGFERWVPLHRRFVLGDLVFALFDARPEALEDFAEGWANEPYLWAWHDGLAETCVFGPEVGEAFSPGWANDDYAWSWAAVAAEPALFGSEPHEAFVTTPWLASWAEAPAAPALFDGGSTETFAGLWQPASTI